jgi:VWFA-related protein
MPFNRISVVPRAWTGAIRLTLASLFLIPAALAVFGQTPVGSDEVIRIDTDLLPFDVLVTDASGRIVKGLEAKDFRILEDGLERPVSFFNIEQVGGPQRPMAIVFALDVSGSMSSGEMVRVRDAMRVFIDKLADRRSVFAIMTFGFKVRTLQSFTNDRQKLESALTKLLQDRDEGRSTHAYDAADDAVRLLVRKAPRTRDQQLLKRAIVMVTDGFPVGDVVAPATVVERANEADVSIYSVTLPSYPYVSTSAKRTPLPTLLDVSGLVEKTGGKSVYATDEDFTPLFRSLADEVASHYVLAFYPADEKRQDGQFHTVRIVGPAGLVLRQSRPGYTASPPKRK